MNLIKNVKSIKGTYQTYNLEGGSATIYFPRSLFAGDPPDTIAVSGVEFVAGGGRKTPKAKMTPEERTAQLKAAAETRKNMTPVQRAEAAKKTAEKAAARAAKLEAAASAAPQA